MTHLHVHTQYSTLDGASQIPALIEKAISDGMTAMAITDPFFHIFYFKFPKKSSNFAENILMQCIVHQTE